MKRIIIAIVMLIFAICVSTLSAYFFDKKVTEFSNAVENIYNKPNKEKIAETVSDWQSAEAFFKFITVHETVNEIGIAFASLERSDESNAVKEICSELITLLKILDDSEKASAENIF